LLRTGPNAQFGRKPPTILIVQAVRLRHPIEKGEQGSVERRLRDLIVRPACFPQALYILIRDLGGFQREHFYVLKQHFFLLDKVRFLRFALPDQVYIFWVLSLQLQVTRVRAHSIAALVECGDVRRNHLLGPYIQVARREM
jgi:hypothetical protein